MAWSTVTELAASVGADIYKRPFITVGFTALMLHGAAGGDVHAGMIRRLGGKRWQALHRLIYVAAIAGVVHYWWLVKADVRRHSDYAVIVGVLLALRALVGWRRASAPARAQAA